MQATILQTSGQNPSNWEAVAQEEKNCVRTTTRITLKTNRGCLQSSRCETGLEKGYTIDRRCVCSKQRIDRGGISHGAHQVTHHPPRMSSRSLVPLSGSIRNHEASALALRSLLNSAKWAAIFLPNSDGPIKNARGPLRSSDCVKIVAVPSWVGSIRNWCSPATVRTGGPCHENMPSEFSFAREESLALSWSWISR